MPRLSFGSSMRESDPLAAQRRDQINVRSPRSRRPESLRSVGKGSWSWSCEHHCYRFDDLARRMRKRSTSTVWSPHHGSSAFVRALTHADISALERSFATDATLFMPFEEFPRRLEGITAIRDAFAPYFSDLRASDREPPYFRLEPRDISVRKLGDGVAVVTFHLRELPQSATDGPVRFSRRTFVVKRCGSEWRIAHLHASNVTVAAPALH